MGDIVFLAHRIPFPPDRGDKMRSWHLLRHLAGLAKVHLLCFADDAADAAHLTSLREALGGRLGEAHVEVRPPSGFKAVMAVLRGRPVSLAMFDSADLRARVGNILQHHDVSTIFAFSSQMAQFVPASAAPRFVMDFVDMDSAKFADYGASGWGLLAWLYRREARTLLSHERATAERADVSLFVSQTEADLFKARSGFSSPTVRALGNGVDLDFYDPQAAFRRLDSDERGEGPLIVFTGQMDYRPNIEAVTAFANNVMPILRSSHPQARFAIVGRNPGPAVRQLEGQNGVIVTGAVDDVRGWLDAASVAVAPLAIARGIQNKVLEAMAMARPVLASSAAFAGIDAEPGRELLVADTAADQAKALAHLLNDPEDAKRLGKAARARVEASYGWEAKLAPLAGIVGFGAREAAA